MVNRPKQIGTAAETAALKIILPYFPSAKRVTLHGSQDQGDIDSGDGERFLFEVKGGKQAHQIGDQQLAGWMGETDAERDFAGKEYGILITQRPGFGVKRADRWWVYLHVGDFARIVGGEHAPGVFSVARLELGQFLDLIADHGLTPDTGQGHEVVIDEGADYLTFVPKYVDVQQRDGVGRGTVVH